MCYLTVSVKDIRKLKEVGAKNFQPADILNSEKGGGRVGE
jgi:hypothetical protein